MGRILYIETYPTGSHRRMLELLQRHSRHQIRAICTPLEHWKWIVGTAHHHLPDLIAEALSDHWYPELVILSGPINIGAALMLLPRSIRELPLVRYIHESQWSYPNPPDDLRPYLAGHIDAVRIADQTWFNSTYHRHIFFERAMDYESERVRKLARRILPAKFRDSRIIYPPVALETAYPAQRTQHCPRIGWVARWEREKRPDLFVSAVEQLAANGVDFEIVLLGAGSHDHDDADRRALAPYVTLKGPLLDRSEYEQALHSLDVVISTAEHEFFGIAMLEAALAGATPILPRALAYPETLPSAWFYPSGDIERLARLMAAALEQGSPQFNAHRSDAARFLPSQTVIAFDDACDALLS